PSQAALASRRIRPDGPSAARTAATRSTSSASGPPPTFTFTVVTPAATASAASPAAVSAATAGTRALTGTSARTGAGQATNTASLTASSHRRGAQGYPGSGENSPHPAGPATSAASRNDRPPSGTRSGPRTREGAGHTALVEEAGAGRPQPHRQRALVRLGVGLDVAQIVGHEQGAGQQADRHRAHHGQAGQPLELHVGRTGGGDEPEEDQHRQLAEPGVPVGLRPAGVEGAGGDAGGADQEE